MSFFVFIKCFYFGLSFLLYYYYINIGFSIILFWIFLLIIYLRVLKFGFFYIQIYYYYYYYFYFLFLFLIVIMIFLISFSNHLVYIYWDLLGLVSFFLVIYYNNNIRLKGSLETLMCNRWGDFFILVFFCFSFSFLLYYNIFFFGCFFLLLSSLVKRAQFPFIG
jgi:NADH-ubiquinone oxidoreductase chain 5